MKRTEKLTGGMICWMCLVLILAGCAGKPSTLPKEAALRPQMPEEWLVLGRNHLFSNNFTEAASAFRQALQLNNEYLPAYKHLALALTSLQQYQESQETYLEALRIFDHDSELWTAYGYCLIDLDQGSEAIKAFSRSITLNTDELAVASAKLGIAAVWRKVLEKRSSSQTEDEQALTTQTDQAVQAGYEEAIKAYPEITQLLKEEKATK